MAYSLPIDALSMRWQVPELLASFAVSKVLIVNDGRPGADAVLTDILDEAGLPYCAISVLKEPSTESVESGVRFANTDSQFSAVPCHPTQLVPRLRRSNSR